MSSQSVGMATSYGEIPQDWALLDLRELCRTIVDGTHFTPRYVESGVPFYSVENVTGNSFSETKFISAEEHEHLTRRCKPERGDILLTRIGALGETKLIDWDVEASIYVSLALLKMNGLVDPGYIYAVSKTAMFRREVERRSLINAIPQKINMDAIGGIPVPVPSRKEEQQAIAQALSDIDDLIVSLDALIAKKRAIKQGTMQQLLTGKCRLPGFSGRWGDVKLADLCTMKSGEGITSRNISEAGAYPVYGANGLRGFSARYTHNGVYPLIGRVGALCGNIQVARGKFFASEHAIVAAAKEHTDPEWLALALGTLGLNQLSEASAQPVLTVSKLSILSLRAPADEQEQRAISHLISDMDEEIRGLSDCRSKFSNIRQGMMYQLLTGRIRLV